MRRKNTQVPTFDQLMNPTLKALRELGGSGTKQEIYEKVIEILKLPDEIIEIPHKKEGGSQTKVDYRLAWALTYLGKAGVVENSARGVWALSSSNSFDKVEPKDIVKHYRDMCRPKKKASENFSPDGEMELFPDDIEISDEQDWRTNLRKVLVSMKPDAFERLVQRILRESGFIQVEVTGKSGDGGIDGKGIAQINGLLSFHVMFQCKRYSSSVTAPQIRDFRGAMTGRTDKGLFITTSSFTRDAIKEATRDGAPPIDLIDGERLIDTLKTLSLGVKTIERVDIDLEWFDKL